MNGSTRDTKNTYVELSPLAFRCAWLGILLLHGLCVGYFTLVAWVYWYLPVSYPELGVDSYAIYMNSREFRLLSIVHWVVVSAHGTLAMLMVVSSFVQRRLVFVPFQDIDLVKALGQSLEKSTRGGRGSLLWLLQRLLAVANKLFGRFSLFGVESRSFDVMMIAREAMETALQSYQAYRMSLYVPRVWLNRLFVALLVLNCSVTPLVLVFFKRRPMTCRLLYLLCDCVLDLMSSIGIPLILLPAYVKEFDPKVGGFDLSLSYDDVWYVSAVSELQLVFISSWMDLFSRVVFYIGFVGCMKSMKDLLRPKAGHARKRVRPASGAPTDIQTAVFSIPTSYDCAFVPTLKPLEPKPSGFPSLTTGTSPSNRRLKHLIHPGFVGWGLAIMILHLRAERQESLAQCLVQVRPWTAKKPACSLLSMDCHLDDGLGYAEDITPHWDHVDEATVTRIVIRHCSQLYIPPKITTLTNVYTIKIYNSTVVDWGNEAALTNRHHPWLNVFLVLRSNFTDGQLPRGLLSADFPLILKGIEFQISNLRTLPDDLDTKWHSRSYLVFENCQFDQFPLVLQRLAPNVISFAFNRIGIVPFGVFQVNGITHLNLADNPISPLSKPSRSTFASISSIISLDLVRTNVSYLPRWIDPILNRAAITPVVLLRDSPFCVHRNEIADSRRSHFLELDFVPLDQLSDTMRLTAPQLHMLDKKVSYTSSEIYYYLYERDDALNRLQVAT